jgi:hypothetical protein
MGKAIVMFICVGLFLMAGYTMYQEAKRNTEVIVPEIDGKCNVTIPNLTPYGWCLKTDKNRNRYWAKNKMKLYIGRIKRD